MRASRRNSVPRRSGTRRGPTRAAAGESWPAVQEISLKLLPLYFGHGGVEAGADTHAQDAVARLEARGLTGQGDGQGGGRSEERRVGKECRSRWWRKQEKEKKKREVTVAMR